MILEIEVDDCRLFMTVSDSELVGLLRMTALYFSHVHQS